MGRKGGTGLVVIGLGSTIFSHSTLVPESLTIGYTGFRFHPHRNWPGR
jgi:hypothetical protein